MINVMNFYWLLIGTLTVWRITSLVGSEDGPWDAFVNLREWAGNGHLGKGLSCFYCLSLWIAAPFALLIGETWIERLLLWPALSAGAILLHRVTQPDRVESPALYFEDKES
ncbi:MAG TPA: hypothetical protein VFZ23_08025 [Pyrinomonadaceae bacterium]